METLIVPALEPAHSLARTTLRGAFRSTVAALIVPKRLLPICAVAIPLLVAQWSLSDRGASVPMGLLMCGVFFFFGPASYRILVPEDGPAAGWPLPLHARVLLYVLLSAAFVLLVGWLLPLLLDLPPSFLTNRWSLLVEVGLFAVGGFGLGRDIDLEEGLARERRRADVLAREAEHAQLLALRSHLDPHFVFNTLNAIAEWCREDGETAERAVLQLSSMLRIVLAGVKTTAWPLARELALVDELFSLHLIRDPSLFELVRSLPDPLPAIDVPPMLLLPIAENAVKHGPACGHRGRLELTVAEGLGQVVIALENPGAFGGRRPGGEGIQMVERRLFLTYGPAGSIAIEELPTRTRVVVTIPASDREHP